MLAARAGDSAAWTELLGRFDRTLRRHRRRVQAGARRRRLCRTSHVAGSAPRHRARPRARRHRRLAWHRDTPQSAAAPTSALARAPHRWSGREQQPRPPRARGKRPGKRAPRRPHPAIATLPDRHRRLMTLLLTQPTLDYQQISQRLAMPVGSIGPIRARSLARLSHHSDCGRFDRSHTGVSQARAAVPLSRVLALGEATNTRSCHGQGRQLHRHPAGGGHTQEPQHRRHRLHVPHVQRSGPEHFQRRAPTVPVCSSRSTQRGTTARSS